MTTTRSTERPETSLIQDLLSAIRYYLGGRRSLLVLAGLVVIAGLALNWSWLVAAGIAPILISVLPCLAMCALGLCMNRAGGKSCSSDAGAQETPTTNDDTLPATRAIEPDVPAAAAPIAKPDPQPPKDRSTTDA